MRSSIEWQDDAANASVEERATVADWQLLVGEQNVTQHRVGARVYGELTLPLCHLAEGLARDWWTLFGARDAATSLVRHRVGFAVPDVRLSFDGAAFEVWAVQKAYANPPALFWGGPAEALRRDEAEAQLSGFISEVVARLASRGVASSGAALRWARVQASRADPAEAEFCEAAGALRQDPYAIDDGTAALIEEASELFEGEALLEFLGGIGHARRQETLEWVKGVERRPAYDSRLPDLRSLADGIAAEEPERAGERGYALGYRRARAARSQLALTQADRVRSTLELSAKLGSRTFRLAPPVNGLRALRTTRRNMEHVHLRTQGDQDWARPGHLFALARAVGDAVCFPGARRSPINELHDAYRQSAGRAFAAEFLAPIQELRSMREDGFDTATISAEFGVASQVIERQLENEERIHAACAGQPTGIPVA